MNEGLAYLDGLLSDLGDSIVAGANFLINVDENLFRDRFPNRLVPL